MLQFQASALPEVLLGSYDMLLLEQFPLKTYRNTMAIWISISWNNAMDEAQINQKKNVKYNGKLSLWVSHGRVALQIQSEQNCKEAGWGAAGEMRGSAPQQEQSVGAVSSSSDLQR